jgi:NADP-dependent 3-hydroxy acid dehydrogenase YdfG
MLADLVKEIKETTGNNNVSYFVADVTSEVDCARLVEYTLTTYGKIDRLILAAGVAAHSTVADMENLDVYRKLMDVNLYGCVNLTMCALPHLRETQGEILAIGSLSSIVPFPHRSGYCATKQAMTGFFRTLRLEEEDIKVLMAHPSTIAGTNFRKNSLASNA